MVLSFTAKKNYVPENLSVVYYLTLFFNLQVNEVC